MTDATISPAELSANSELVETGWKRLAMHILVFVIIIGAWELAGVFNQLNDLLLPAPSVILGKFANMWLPEFLGGTGRIYYHFMITMWEATAGFFIGVTIGVSLAVTAAISPVPRTSPTRGISRRVRSCRWKYGAISRTWASRFSRSMMSQLARAAAQDTGLPDQV